MATPRAIAIVGVAGRFPGASDVASLWENILAGRSTARSVPAERWPIAKAKALDPLGAVDTTRSDIACLLEPWHFNDHGLRPADLGPTAKLVVDVARTALSQANLASVAPERIALHVANIALPTDGSSALAEEVARGQLPSHPSERSVCAWPVAQAAKALGLGGGCFTLDAACASSLYAVALACDALERGDVDAVVAGGVSLAQNLYTQIGFTQLKALSPSGRCAPFDARADGLVVGEGCGLVVLRRLEDAVAAGEPVLAVIRGIGVSNDVGGSLLSPETEGQVRAMRQAYAQAGWAPAEVGLVECHGTGTPRGDAVELASLSTMWSDAPGCVLGSVKSNVGHLLTGAGAVALAKVVTALAEGVLPPSANFSAASPSPALLASPFRVLEKPEPWAGPRRAAVSGFGFGGINAHLLIEAFDSNAPALAREPMPAEPIAIVGIGAHVGALESAEAFGRAVLNGNAALRARPATRWRGLDRHDALASLPQQGGWIEDFAFPNRRFRIPPNELANLLPQQLLMLKVAAEALDDAAPIGDGPHLRTGVIVGLGLDLETTTFHLRWRSGESFGPALDSARTQGALGGLVASRVAREFQFGGPSFGVSGEETSGARALMVASRLLQRGEVDSMLVGAIDVAGDIRNVAALNQLRPFSRSARVAPFDVDADGPLPGEGAVAVVLKRLSDAVRDADHIYGVLRGFGEASGGGADEARQAKPSTEATAEHVGLSTEQPAAATEDNAESNALHQFNLRDRASRDSRTTSPVGAPAFALQRRPWSAMGRALVDADISSEALGLVMAHGSGSPAEDHAELSELQQLTLRDCAISSLTPITGQLGAASSLASVVAAALALHHQSLPPLSNLRTPQAQVPGAFSLTDASPWVRDRAVRPRVALVNSVGLDGTSTAVVLQAHEPSLPRQSLISAPSALFLLGDAEGPALFALCRQQTNLHDLARIWAHRPTPATIVRSIVAESVDDLIRQLAQTPRPKVRLEGKVAFLFPGSGSHFIGMNDGLHRLTHESFRALDAEVESFASQLMLDWVSPRRWGQPAQAREQAGRALGDSPERMLLAQVAHGALTSDALQQAGLQPDAWLGYSLGESAALFASRAWRARDEMFTRTAASPLFTEQLCGRRTVAQAAWGTTADWYVVVVPAPANEVRKALGGTASLLIVNTPHECVVGGLRADVQASLDALGTGGVPLEGVPTVHLPMVNAVGEAYRALHQLPVSPITGTFYSCGWGRSYAPSTEACAESILHNATGGFDFTQAIEAAWNDGVRFFIEAGPGNSCARMVSRTLDERPHFAVSASQRGINGARSLLEAVGAAAERGATVSLQKLYPPVSTTRAPASELRLPITFPPLASNPRRATATPTPVQKTHPRPLPTPSSTAIMTATAAAHEAFLRFASQSIAFQTQLLDGTSAVLPVVTRPASAPKTAPAVVFDREACLTFARGKLGDMLGPSFAQVDAYPTRVRFPDEPLMLCDRIVQLDAEAHSMKQGLLVTEHDVLPDAWYLDGGRAPVCISVEAGQADLFLSGYLGIDSHTKGLAKYRLLDAKIVFHRGLPLPGETIRYAIRIDRFIQQADTWLFFFRFDGTINGQPFITMFDGCAGFFTESQLATGKGIVPTSGAPRPRRTLRDGSETSHYQPLLPLQRSTLTDAQVEALRAGDLSAAFGDVFSGLTLAPALRLPSGRMHLVDRIVELDPTGGEAGLGLVVGEHDITPDAWYLTCHFIDDQVMPGTLMYECCLHTLRVLLLRMGWLTDDASLDVHYAPVEGIASQLKCRGQVLTTSKRVSYRVELREVGYDPEPYVIATAQMTIDGKPSIGMEGMSVKVKGLTQQGLEAFWQKRSAPKSVAFTREQILAYAEGNPSECFGPEYAPFDRQRRLARLPRPPFLFLDRVRSVDAPPWRMQPTGWVEGEYDVPPEAWYFAANANRAIPFSVLLEAALQPCGWLAAYVGSALTSDTDLHFRNLDGNATQHLPIYADAGTLRTRARLSKVSRAGGMLLQNFELEVLRGNDLVYSGTTGFGFFPSEALAQQVGVRGAAWAEVTAPVVPSPSNWPTTRYRFVDDVRLTLDGGPMGLGVVAGSQIVDPSAWYFQAHFYQDPVMPGSLGLEALLQLMQAWAWARWPEKAATHHVQAMALHSPHTWQYRGQVVPTHQRVDVQGHITKVIDGDEPSLFAAGQLAVDGRIIYRMSEFSLQLVENRKSGLGQGVARTAG